jgi:hypothetical protein
MHQVDIFKFSYKLFFKSIFFLFLIRISNQIDKLLCAIYNDENFNFKKVPGEILAKRLQVYYFREPSISFKKKKFSYRMMLTRLLATELI